MPGVRQPEAAGRCVSVFRYLYCSKELVQMKREEMKRLKEKMGILQQKLER